MAACVPFPIPVDLKTNILQNWSRNFLLRKYSRPFEEVIEDINSISKSDIGRSEKLEGIKHNIHRCFLYRQELPLEDFGSLLGAYQVEYENFDPYEPLSGEASEEACLGDFYKNIEDYHNLRQLIFKEPFQGEVANAQRKITARGCLALWEDWDTYSKELDGVTTDDVMDIIETNLEHFPFENPGQQLAVIKDLLSKLKDDDTKKYDLKYRLLYILKGLVSEAPLLNGDAFEAPLLNGDAFEAPLLNDDAFYVPFTSEEKASPSKTLESLVKKASPGSARGLTQRDGGKKHLNGYSKAPMAPMSSAKVLFPANDQRTRSYTTLKTCLIAFSIIVVFIVVLYVNRATLAPYVRRVKKWFGKKIGSF